MNKHLLIVAGLLSLLAVNQAFGWTLSIKNEANIVALDFYFLGGHKDSRRLKGGNTYTRDLKLTLEKISVSHGGSRRLVAEFYPRKDSNGNPINPEKGLTIKTVDGKTVIVENQ